jgi:2-polyprenyl-6-hydroxyphenyl methylase/3-demethylubiquinone-9 3-methyltransferase
MSAVSESSACTPNADPAELAKFQALAAKWWDPNSEFRPLHEINPLRLDWINALCPLDGSKVVDIGCGGGILSEAMAGLGANVLGVDLARRSLAVAELHALESGARVRYEMIAAEALAEREPATYDVVTCMEMLEHVPNPASTIRACAALVKPGGWVFFSTINRNPKSFLFAIVGAEYILRLLPRGTHDYAKLIRPSEMDAAARRAGLTLQRLTGMVYNPFTRKYRLEAGDLSVNYLAAFRRPIEG